MLVQCIEIEPEDTYVEDLSILCPLDQDQYLQQ